MRLSPPGSSGGSSQAMIPPPHPFAIAAPTIPRTTTLTAPNIPQVGSRSPGYSSNSYSHSTSPSTASGSLPDSQNHDGPSLIISPTQISSAALNAQKRAYRQRRKDPSCDACRERKVKVSLNPFPVPRMVTCQLQGLSGSGCNRGRHGRLDGIRVEDEVCL